MNSRAAGKALKAVDLLAALLWSCVKSLAGLALAAGLPVWRTLGRAWRVALKSKSLGGLARSPLGKELEEAAGAPLTRFVEGRLGEGARSTKRLFDSSPAARRLLLLAAALALLKAALSAESGLPANARWEQAGDCVASYYDKGFLGKPTANGEIFDPSEMTAAHKTLPFDTWVKARNPANGREVVVRINDRGPYIEGRDLDLSRAAANALGMTRGGVARVELKVLKEKARPGA